jgi:hypothetical protein
LLAAFILARAGAGFLPCRIFGVSGYFCASPYLFLPLGQSRTVVAENAFGEGARAANRGDYVVFRREQFTVDERGYRNLPETARARPRVILTGSSFSLGLSLSDEDTLSEQLNRRLGPIVFNASNVLNESLSATGSLQAAQSLGMENGLVLLELVNRGDYGYRRESPARFELPGAPFHSIERRVRNPQALARASALMNMELENDHLLPNPFRDQFPEKELVTGSRMLFFRDDRRYFQNPGDPGTTAAAAVRLRDDLAGAHFRLVVILVPTGYTVYYPLMREPEGPDRGGQYVESLAETLKARGIPVFDCLPVLRDAAARELARGRLVYWPDDAHWNPDGVAAVAERAAPWLRMQLDAAGRP